MKRSNPSQRGLQDLPLFAQSATRTLPRPMVVETPVQETEQECPHADLGYPCRCKKHRAQELDALGPPYRHVRKPVLSRHDIHDILSSDKY